MITASEARMLAARAVLESVARLRVDPGSGSTTEDARLVADELRKIEHWLRREAMGHDKIAIRQVERELGRQVRGPKR